MTESIRTTAAETMVLHYTPSSKSTPIGANAIGIAAWHVEKNYSNCSAPYARVAGRVLNRLRAMGLVERCGDFLFWKRTRAGDEHIGGLFR